ncbi:hypothetical protein E4U48_004720 [Claviceps purpurea]|nr:hypothetical protein E4U48_004720 [Claviceps purpurea]
MTIADHAALALASDLSSSAPHGSSLFLTQSRETTTPLVEPRDVAFGKRLAHPRRHEERAAPSGTVAYVAADSLREWAARFETLERRSGSSLMVVCSALGLTENALATTRHARLQCVFDRECLGSTSCAFDTTFLQLYGFLISVGVIGRISYRIRFIKMVNMCDREEHV